MPMMYVPGDTVPASTVEYQHMLSLLLVNVFGRVLLGQWQTMKRFGRVFFFWFEQSIHRHAIDQIDVDENDQAAKWWEYR